MIYLLKFKCGHEEKVSIKGNQKFREIHANTIIKEVCSKCKENK